MDTYTIALIGAVSPQVIAALIGGFIGLMYSAKPSKYGWWATIISTLAGLIAAGAAGEYLSTIRGVQSLWWCALLGAASGVPFGALMDTIRVLSPPLFEKIIHYLGDTVIDEMAETVKRFFSLLKEGMAKGIRFFKGEVSDE